MNSVNSITIVVATCFDLPVFNFATVEAISRNNTGINIQTGRLFYLSSDAQTCNAVSLPVCYVFLVRSHHRKAFLFDNRTVWSSLLLSTLPPRFSAVISKLTGCPLLADLTFIFIAALLCNIRSGSTHKEVLQHCSPKFLLLGYWKLGEFLLGYDLLH